MLLETVADKTGYPAEMLELDMRLDADLGIDSIKRVEIFSAVQDRLPRRPRSPARGDRHARHAASRSLDFLARPQRTAAEASRRLRADRPPRRRRVSGTDRARTAVRSATPEHEFDSERRGGDESPSCCARSIRGRELSS